MQSLRVGGNWEKDNCDLVFVNMNCVIPNGVFWNSAVYIWWDNSSLRKILNFKSSSRMVCLSLKK